MTVVAVAAGAILASLGVAAIVYGLWPSGLGSGIPSVGLASCRLPGVIRLRAVGPRAASGVGAGGLVWVVTGWPVAGLWVGLLAGWLPSLAGRSRARRADADRVEAVARWAEMVRDQVRVGADVAQAITGAAVVAPEPIAGPAARLGRRISVGDTDEALAGFADELNDPMGDVLAVALAMALSRPTGRLSDLLGELARATREQASVRLRVETDRQRLRTVTWGVLVAVAGWLTAIYVLSGRYLAAYDSATGQAVLLIAGGAFAAGLAGLARMDRVAVGPRLSLSGGGRR
jgi:Flp pilus assembly protein TadB